MLYHKVSNDTNDMNDIFHKISGQDVPACSSGNLNFSTGNCEITTTIPASCPQGTALSGNVCAGHPIPRGPQPG